MIIYACQYLKYVHQLLLHHSAWPLVLDEPPAPVASSIPDPPVKVGNNTAWEIITGLYASNTTRSEGTTTFDNRGATVRGSSGNVSYPNLIIQAKPGDVINLIGRINTGGNYKVYCEFWVWLGGGVVGLNLLHPMLHFLVITILVLIIQYLLVHLLIIMYLQFLVWTRNIVLIEVGNLIHYMYGFKR